MRLFEQYRPQSWPELIGQERAIAKIDILRRRGLGGRCYWISGPSGSGKTTTAYLIAAEIAERESWFEMPADKLDVDYLDSMRRTMRLYGGLFGKRGLNGWAWIFNESHGLSRKAVRLLLDLTEHDLTGHCVIIFTTTTDGLKAFEDNQIDAAPLLSRCTELKLTNQGLAQKAAELVRQIAVKEGMNGKPISAYLQLARDMKNNIRRMLEEIEAGAMLP